MVVAVAGNIDHDEVVALVREYFGARLVRGRNPVPPRKGTGRLSGRPGLHADQPGRRADPPVAGRAGAGPGLGSPLGAVGAQHRSRRWPEFAPVPQIRETRGLAYSVYSTVDTFCDSGALSVYAGCLPERFDEVVG